MKYISTKKYGHDRGLSCCFRQWKATSHCNRTHGYSLAFEFVFESDTLDERNWVQDFGDLKWLKNWLELMFDHTTLVALDDPYIEEFGKLHQLNVIDIRYVEATGCEKIAEMVFKYTSEQLNSNVTLRSVQVWEHEGNSARYER